MAINTTPTVGSRKWARILFVVRSAIDESSIPQPKGILIINKMNPARNVKKLNLLKILRFINTLPAESGFQVWSPFLEPMVKNTNDTRIREKPMVGRRK